MAAMAVFFGEMQMRDHPAKMPAVVHVDKANIKIQSGKTQLGEWKLYQVKIEEQDRETIVFRVDDEELLLHLREHDSFLAETANYQRDDSRARRLEHEAFRRNQDTGPTLSEELREDVGREVSGVSAEIRALWDTVYGGTGFWIGVAVFLLMAIFIPTVLVGILFAVGVVSLVVGAIAYTETSVAVKLPDALTPTLLLAVGVVGIGLGIVVAIIA